MKKNKNTELVIKHSAWSSEEPRVPMVEREVFDAETLAKRISNHLRERRLPRDRHVAIFQMRKIVSQ